MRNLWDDTPMDKLLSFVGKFVTAAVSLSILAIPVLLVIALIHVLAKYW